jgi:hypothetical protein
VAVHRLLPSEAATPKKLKATEGSVLKVEAEGRNVLTSESRRLERADKRRPKAEAC